jgi:hypothetical protein
LNQEIGEIPSLKLNFSDVSIIPCSLPDLLGSFLELDITSRLLESQGDYDQEHSVLDHLDPFLPPRSEGLVYEPGINGSSDGPEDGDKGEESGRDGTIDWFPNVTKGSSDQNRSDRSEHAQNTSTDQDLRDVVLDGTRAGQRVSPL